jgi:magnesium-transporting ATPase (P-type)
MSATATTTTTTNNATNPESKKHDDTKKMWSTNYRETENPAIRQKWIDNAYGSTATATAPKEQSSTTTVTNPSLGASMQITTIFLFAWVFLGLIAFVWSLYCFRKSGSTEQKLLGFLLAIFLGPLFFIYFRFSKNYCK